MVIERIALVNPNRWKPKTAPLGLEYLSSALESQGFAVDLLDLCHASDVGKTIRSFFSEHRPDLVGITHRNLDDVLYGRFMVPELRDIIRQVRDATDAPMVLGGSGFSICPEQVLNSCRLDLGIAGEGEFALPMLARNFGNLEAYKEVPGLVYRVGSEFRRNPVGMGDITGMRFSARSKVDDSRYVHKSGLKGATGVQTKRGCAQDCIYCVVPAVEGRVMRLHPVADIVDEIESVMAKGVRRFFFCDSEFNYPEEHAIAVCQEIVDRNLGGKISWSVYTAPKPFSLELAKLMVEAGCKLAIFTIENANEEILRCMRKDFTPDDVKRMARFSRDAGLKFSCSTMLGGPGETMSTVLETLNLLKEARANAAFADPPGLRIYPNTPLVDIVREEGFNKRNPNLHGRIEGNEDFFEPVYYLSAQMGVLATAIKGWRKLGLARQAILAMLG
ncbi:MAG TPA: radical SAM protein [Armatimonadota bacterium]|nr:radical SAM protein [Armatimonadota bacterium]